MHSTSPIHDLAQSIRAIHHRVTELERRAARGADAAGTYVEGAWTAAPAGYLLMGQTVVNAQTLYPALWAVAPVGWRSGTSLVLPVRADSAIKT